MGEVFLVVFEETQNPNYYMCKDCRTHIAIDENYVMMFEDEESLGLLFTKAVNLEVDRPERHRQLSGHTVADVYCITCREKLGWKYIQVGSGQDDIEDNMVELMTSKLLRILGGKTVDDFRSEARC